MYSCKLFLVICLSSSSVSDVNPNQSDAYDDNLADVSADSNDSFFPIPRERFALLKLPPPSAYQLERYGYKPRYIRRRGRTTLFTSLLPTLDNASDADDEDEEQPRRRKKNHLARRLRTHQFLVHGPALANMPFDQAYRWRIKLSSDSLSSKILKSPKHMLHRIRNRPADKRLTFACETVDHCFKDPTLLLCRLVDIFLEHIRKVVDCNSKIFCRVMSTIKRDPGRLVMLLTVADWGLTVEDILEKIFETITGGQSENFISFVVSILLKSDLFEQRRVIAKEKKYWMIRASRYRQLLEEYTSSSDE